MTKDELLESLSPGEFAILPHRLEALGKTLARLAKKTVKKGGVPATLEIVRSVPIQINAAQVLPVYVIRVQGTLPKEDGYSLVCSIEHTLAGNIVRATPGFYDEDLSRVRTLENHCGHCNKKRLRRNTYLLQKEGEEIQVGHNCLADFLRSEVAASIVSYYDALEIVTKEPLDFDFHGGPLGFSLDYVLSTAHREVSRYGYRTTDKEHSTKSMVLRALARPLGGKPDKDWQDAQPTEEDFAKVPEIKEFVQGMDGSDYAHNLKVALELPCVEPKHVGLVASAVGAFYREKSKVKATARNEFYGAVKDRCDLDLTLQKKREFDTNFGPVSFYLFEDKEGRTFLWKTGAQDLDVGDRVQGKGTIKKHETYQGICQTVLSRCRFTKV